jgi:hypothetical protein
MNRGSALKWADLIEDENYNINECGGCFKDADGNFDYIGILVDFVNDGQWKNTGLVFHVTPDGACATLPDNVKKKCKIKTDLSVISDITDGDIILNDGKHVRLDTRSLYVRKAVANCICENYETL